MNRVSWSGVALVAVIAVGTPAAAQAPVVIAGEDPGRMKLVPGIQVPAEHDESTADAAIACQGEWREGPLSSDPSTVVILASGADFRYDERVFLPTLYAEEKYLVFTPLAVYDRFVDSSPRPGLAASWEPSPDMRRWTVRLRPGLHWHDGAPITSRDVAFTFELLARFLGPSFGTVEVIDDLTFLVHYPEPSRRLLNGWDDIYPAHLLADLEPTEITTWEFWTRSVGSGPYRYVCHVPGEYTLLEAFPGSSGVLPDVRKIILLYGGGGSMHEIAAGRVDMARPDHGEAQRLRQLDGLEYGLYPVLNPLRIQLIWNLRDPRLAAPEVRRALTMAIDRERMHSEVHGLPGLPLHDGLCEARGGYLQNRCSALVPFDARAARRTLAAHGRAADAPGADRTEGKVFALELLAPRDEVATAEFVAAALREAGIAVTLTVLSNSELRRRLREGDFAAAIDELPDLVRSYRAFFDPEGPTGYEAPEFTALLDAALASVDPATTDSLLEEASAHFTRDLPATFLGPKIRWWAVHDRIQGLEPPYRSNPLLRMAELRIGDPR